MGVKIHPHPYDAARRMRAIFSTRQWTFKEFDSSLAFDKLDQSRLPAPPPRVNDDLEDQWNLPQKRLKYAHQMIQWHFDWSDVTSSAKGQWIFPISATPSKLFDLLSAFDVTNVSPLLGFRV
jgi:hypothetical protein